MAERRRRRTLSIPGLLAAAAAPETGAQPPADLVAALQDQPAMHVLRFERRLLERWLAPESGRQLDDHLYLVDPMGEWMMRFPADFDPARVRRDIDRLMRASASWDRPGR